MANMTPSLGAKGLYRLKTPWQIPAGAIYECIAIRSFDDFVDRGIDPLSKVYTPVQLGQPALDADKAAGAKIITLRSSVQALVFVPDTYIESYPALDGVPYSQVVLSVNLGAIPDELNLAFVKDQIADTVAASFGITPTVNVNVAPSTNYVTAAQHDQFEIGRQAAITNNQTSQARILELQNIVTRQAEQITNLENILVAEGLLPS